MRGTDAYLEALATEAYFLGHNSLDAKIGQASAPLGVHRSHDLQPLVVAQLERARILRATQTPLAINGASPTLFFGIASAG
jgi:hypothetical protein